jgi:hypothetical protein
MQRNTTVAAGNDSGAFAPNAQINKDRKAEDIELADQIVPGVG